MSHRTQNAPNLTLVQARESTRCTATALSLGRSPRRTNSAGTHLAPQ